MCFSISSGQDTCIYISICPEKSFCKHRKVFIFATNIRIPLRYMPISGNHFMIFVQISSFFFTAGAMDVSAL